MTGGKYCTKCNKGGIIMLCDRCQQVFCNKHIIEHRQQSTNQLDDLIQEHDLIQQELKQSSKQHSLLINIDKWERESIVKIQTAADMARTELREMIETSQERLSFACRDILENLHSSRQDGQFCENDLLRSMQYLKQLKMKIASPLSVQLVEKKDSSSPVIHLITVKGSDFMNNDFDKVKIYSVSNRLPTSTIQEKFSKPIGPVTISDEGFLITHKGPNSTLAYILGEQLYSKGKQTIRFKIEHCHFPYNIFFGCVSSNINLNQIHYNSPFVAGWFGQNEVYEHGVCITNVQMHGYDSNKIETYDVLSLTLNCDEKQIELYPERTKKIHELPVDISKAPFPWQVFVVLSYGNDAVRILHRT